MTQPKEVRHGDILYDPSDGMVLLIMNFRGRDDVDKYGFFWLRHSDMDTGHNHDFPTVTKGDHFLQTNGGRYTWLCNITDSDVDWKAMYELKVKEDK